MQAIVKLALLILASLLCLASFILSLLVLLAPAIVFNDSVALARIHPAVLNLAGNATSKGGEIDGPSVLLGLLGSCARYTNDAPFVCTVPSPAAAYNMSVLPSSIPAFITAPIAVTPVIGLIALIVFFFFTVAFTLSSFREKLPQALGGAFYKHYMELALTWMGAGSWVVLSTVYLVTRVWIGRAVKDTNMLVMNLGKDAPTIAAEVSNGFIMMWVALGFAVVPIGCALTKLHLSGGKA